MTAANVAYSLCSTLDGARELKRELAFLSAISVVLRKHDGVDKAQRGAGGSDGE
jgi:type I restriction enzyme, R subunit